MTAPHHDSARRGCRHEFDWPPQWREIAERVRADSEAIAAGKPLPFIHLRPEHIVLRQRREALGVTQAGFALLANMSSETAGKVERGEGAAGALQRYREALVIAEHSGLRLESQKVNEPTHDLDGGARPSGSRAQRPGR